MGIGRKELKTFKPRARMLLLLGDQLIRDPGIAVFELVKNAYDADASVVSIKMKNVDEPSAARILIKDNGCGMDWDTVTNVWLEPGTDYRGQQRESGIRTSKFQRLPLGEKGVGRFAAHKLGRHVRLVTRKQNCQEVVVEIDWGDFEAVKYLSDAKVSVIERTPKIFTEGKTGTILHISEMRNTWTRGMVRDMHRSVTSISSPFEGPSDFKTLFSIEPDYGWLEGLINIEKVLDNAVFDADCVISQNAKLTYHYSFNPLPGMDKIVGRKNSEHNLDIQSFLEEELGRKINYKSFKIGPVSIKLRIFDREPLVLNFGVSDKQGLKKFLNLNGGIRVYRDGIRVYDYGEIGNDWLGLGGRRVNVPAKRISNNLVIGTVSIELDKSQDLIEKTNREGFVENEAYKVFRSAVLCAIEQIEAERFKDKDRIRKIYSKGNLKEPVLDDLSNLRDEVENRGLSKELGKYIDGIEKQFREVRDKLLTAAGAGLNMSVVVHEVEKGIKELSKALERNDSLIRIQNLANHLAELIEGFAWLTRKSGMNEEKASTLIRQALFNTEYRMQYHDIEVINGLKLGTPDFTVKCSRRLVISTIMNIIDNSIWWLDNKKPNKKMLYIGTSNDFKYGPAIILGDNGPGFIDPPEYLVEPFFTRKRDGMGLGLHISNEVMKLHKGKILFPEPGDFDLPNEITGAVIALVFGGKK